MTTIEETEYQRNLNELMEYKKLLSIIEDELEKKESKLTNMTKLYEELKVLNDKTRQECNELNSKLLNNYNEKALLEQRSEMEIAKTIEKQRDIYEAQILKLSSYDPESLKVKLTAEIDTNYQQDIKKLSNTIEELQAQALTYQSNYDLLQSEYDLYKEESTREITMLKEQSHNEIKDLVFKMQLQAEKMTITPDMSEKATLNAELESLRHQSTDLFNEVLSLRKDKEQLTMEKNALQLTCNKDIDKEKFHNQILIDETERLKNELNSLKEDIEALRKEHEDKCIENQQLFDIKTSLENELGEHDAEFQMFKEEIMALKSKVKAHENDMEKTFKDTFTKNQMQLEQETTLRQINQTQVEELSNELKEVKLKYMNYYDESTKELKEVKKDYEALKEEKIIFMDKLYQFQTSYEAIKEDYDDKVMAMNNYEKEYIAIQGKYRLLAQNEYNVNQTNEENQKKLHDNIREIKNLNAYIATLKEGINKSKANGDIMNKYNELLKKKVYYKNQCKIANQNVIKLMRQLHPSEINNNNLDLFAQSQSDAEIN